MSFFTSFALLATLVLVVGVVERLPRFRFRVLPFRRRYLGTDVRWFLVAGAASAISAFVFRPFLVRLAVEPFRDWVAQLPTAGRLVLALVIFDAASFAIHLGLHRSATLWNLHKVHHSSLQLDGLATTRAHMLENFIRFIPPQAVLFLIGMGVGEVVPAVAIYAAFGVSNHSNLGLNLGWAEGVFITPRLHRRHHIPTTSQKNFGTIFSFWDRMFGRLVRTDTRPEERFGVPGEIDSYPQRFWPAVCRPVVQIREMRYAKVAARDQRVVEEVGAR